MSITTPRFNFFEKEILKDPGGNGENFDKFKDLDVTCSSAGRGQLVICDREGTVFTLDKQLHITAFRAYTKSISLVHQLRQHNVLFSVGEDEDTDFPLCKIWMMDRVDAQDNPHCSRIIRLSSSGGKDSIHFVHQEVTCMAVHENMQLLAFGFKSGAVILYKGEVTKDRQSKFYLVTDGDNRGTGSSEVTGLALRVVQRSQLLFVTTRTSLLAYDISVKDRNALVLKESYGCSPRCSALSDDIFQNQFLVGRSDGVYYVQSEGRGGTAPLEGEKYQVHWYRGYLVTVGRSNINRDMDIVTIYDTLNKFIAYSGPIPHVSNVLFEWNSIYVLAGGNRLYMLLEKATQTKLEILFKKNQYDTAISIAKSQHYDSHGLVDIFRLYGDYLYTERGEHDRAIEQYMKTIGRLEPSYVIRKFLDAQRLHNLTAYLEELHNKLYATEDHTTLLLNCYTKLKDEEKLDEFIQKKDRNNEVNFDIETAIRVLRQADYHEHALQLAERHSRHEWYLKIQLENIKDFSAALKYMQNLSFYEAENAMKKYGKVLIQALPEETTSLLKKLCLGEYSSTERARPDEFIHIFVKNPVQLTAFLEAVLKTDETPAAVVYNTLLELYLQNWAKLKSAGSAMDKLKQEEKTMSLLKKSTGYAKDHALVLCRMHQFKPGILFLYEEGHLYQQILRYYMEQDDYDKVIESCKKWGSDDSHLWVVALAYFAEKEEDLKPQMREVLRNIDEQKLLPPLLVIQTLANSRVCTLGVVKDFIMEQLLVENEQIEKDEKQIQQYIDETQSLRQRIDDLTNKPQVFQASRCSVCKYQLELPSIHFLCQHSYHTHCFESYAENENECPACAEDNRKILETIKVQERSKEADLVRSFAAKLKVAKDGFDVVADYFGKGIFQKEPLLGDLSSPSLPDPSEDRYLSSPAADKVSSGAPFRRNPFSGVPDDMGHAGSFRTSGTPVDSEFPVYRDTNIRPTQRQPVPAAVPKATPSSSSRASSGYFDGDTRKDNSEIDFGSFETRSTRPKPRVAESTPPTSVPKAKSSTHSTTSYNSPSITLSSPKSDIHREPAATRGSSNTLAETTNRSSSPALSGLAVSSASKNAPGHKRQSSAGRVIESGLSFIKGHMRQSSDQSVKKATPPAALPSRGSMEKPKSSSSRVEERGGGSRQTRSKPPAKSSAPNPFEEPSSNPFDEPSSNPFQEKSSNPFEEKSSNPFDEPSSNPFEEPSNPFNDDAAAGTNPFEESKNPFE